jgi:hypothetical protein
MFWVLTIYSFQLIQCCCGALSINLRLLSCLNSLFYWLCCHRCTTAGRWAQVRVTASSLSPRSSRARAACGISPCIASFLHFLCMWHDVPKLVVYYYIQLFVSCFMFLCLSYMKAFCNLLITSLSSLFLCVCAQTLVSPAIMPYAKVHVSSLV